MRSLKYKLLIAFSFSALAFTSCLSLASAATTPVVPTGCPDSSKPADKPPAVCKTIPYGCPGSTKEEGIPPKDNTKCPYTASYGGEHQCGKGAQAVSTSIDIGCKGKGNPIADATFAIIRVLSLGVGLVLTASLIFAGIQYSSSRGNPQETAKAIARIQANVVALIIFVFGYAILNYLIPAGFLK